MRNLSQLQSKHATAASSRHQHLHVENKSTSKPCTIARSPTSQFALSVAGRGTISLSGYFEGNRTRFCACATETALPRPTVIASSVAVGLVLPPFFNALAHDPMARCLLVTKKRVKDGCDR
jgi:hypothetical protein